MRKCDLDTPSLILDLDIFEENLRAMRDFAATAGKKLRPHAKTHKCPEIARRQLACGNCIGICAAKLAEAEALAEAGINAVLITSPISAPWKAARIGKLNQTVEHLQLTVDHPKQVELLSAVATPDNPVHLLIDVDPEMGRTGIAFDQAVEFARYIAGFPNLILDGVQCYAGHLQHIAGGAERNSASTRLMQLGAAAFLAVAAEFPQCRIFTGTGTGTSAADVLIPEVTDIQVGSYCMMDSEYLAIEHTGRQYAPALRMISSVISCNHPGHVTIDAGTKALYVTPGAPPRVIRGNTFCEGFEYTWNFGDEHGQLILPENCVMQPGERVELIVSHCDPTVNLFDELWIVQQDSVVDHWDITLRGCCR